MSSNADGSFIFNGSDCPEYGGNRGLVSGLGRKPRSQADSGASFDN